MLTKSYVRAGNRHFAPGPLEMRETVEKAVAASAMFGFLRLSA